EDLRKQIFPVETDVCATVGYLLWDQLDLLAEYNWCFKNLEDAFEEGGGLHGKNVYLFSCTKPQLLFFNGQLKVTCIPVVAALKTVKKGMGQI
ncbi:hypothetical protein M8C21_004023, partial [Ambrosia artemisiifolia]